MNVSPGSAFFQTVQGSAARSGAHSEASSVRTVQEASQASSPLDRHRSAATDIRVDQDLRYGPPGTNLNIVV